MKKIMNVSNVFKILIFNLFNSIVTNFIAFIGNQDSQLINLEVSSPLQLGGNVILLICTII